MVENLPERDLLLHQFAMFTTRDPLVAVSANTRSSPGKSRTLHHASHIVDSRAGKSDEDHDLVSSAFKCLYVGSSSAGETCLVIKKHQYYIIELTSNKNWRRAWAELATLHGVFGGKSKFSRVLWSLLLEGVACNAVFPVTLVVSYHFLIFQTLLQAISSNLVTVAKGSSELDLPTFQRVAEAFLCDSNVAKWMELLDSLHLEKYHANSVKMLKGFVKVASFLQRRDPLLALLLNLGVQLLRMKLYEFGVKMNTVDESEPKLPDLSESVSIVLPFAKDLHLIVSQAPRLSASEFCSRLSAYCQNGNMSMKYEPENSPRIRKLLSSSLTDATIAEIISFLDTADSESLLQPIHLQILNYLHHRIASHTNNQLAPIVDLYINKMQLITRKSTFSCLLHSFMPSLAAVLGELRIPHSLKQLEIMCFNHYKATSLAESLAVTIEILLCYCRIEASTQEISKALARVERCLEALSAMGEFSKTTMLAYSYMCSFPDRALSPSNRIKNAFAVCFVNTPLASKLFFGLDLEFNDDQKITLATALSEGPELSQKSTQWVSALIFSSPSAQLRCLYQVSTNIQIDVEPPKFQITASVDHLYLAYLRVQKLYRKHVDFRKGVQEIHSDLISWEDSSAEVSPGECSLVLDVLSQLYYLGYFNLTAEVASRLKSKKKFVNDLSNFQLDLLMTDLHLRLARLSDVPDILRDAGNRLKAIHREGAQVDCNLLIRWKLIQLEYFVSMQDTYKISAKFEDIERLMLKFPEYDIKADSSDIPLHRRLHCLLFMAQLLILTSQLNSDLGTYVLALKNLKLALRVLNSIIRKLASTNMKTLKVHTESLMLLSYNRAFSLCRHLGLLKDAIFYLDEICKLNDNIQNPMLNCLFHFNSSTYYASIGKEQECLGQIKKGNVISGHSNIKALEHLSQCSDIVYRALFTPLFKMSKDKLLDFQMPTSLSTDDVFDALCEDYLMDIQIEVDFYMCLNLKGVIHKKVNATTPQKRSMIIQAMAVIYSNLHEVKSMLLGDWSKKFDKAIKQLPHFARLEACQISDAVQRKLLDCKEILNNCLENGWSSHLEVRKARQVYSLFNRCVFLLSFVAVLMPESAIDLLNSVHYLLDFPKNLPYLNQQRINELLGMRNESGNELLPIFNERKAVVVNGIQPDFDESLRTLLPPNWVVVTIDVCGITGDLIFSKFSNADAYPDFYKVPVKESLASFQDILLRLKRIIEDSNRSTTYDVTSKVQTKEDRKLWWQLRFNLDIQLENLLVDVEKHSIGSFNGIFDVPNRKSTGYHDFESKINKIWRSANKNSTSLLLSENIVDLYYCARPFDADGTVNPHLLEDLVTFTLDELTTSKNSTKRELLRVSSLYDQLGELYSSAHFSDTDCKHLVLVPSSACCSFPWESLSILREKSISRVPSIGMLTNLLQKHHTMRVFDEPTKSQIFYLINPGQDLKRTQLRFEPILKSVPGAEGLAGQSPEEEYLISRLYSSGLFVYLGHGGGEQYMRTSTLFKAQVDNPSLHLPPAILMGCSSGAYHANGDLEPTSNVFNWLACGAPMVVANLWDITDKDIDNFSDSVFDKWGFLPDHQLTSKVDICQAVASSRASCTLKYLNGAAPIVHGLPLNFH